MAAKIRPVCSSWKKYTPTMPPTAAAPMTVAFEEACISSSGVLATLDIDTFDVIGAGAMPLKAEADATRASDRKVRMMLSGVTTVVVNRRGSRLRGGIQLLMKAPRALKAGKKLAYPEQCCQGYRCCEKMRNERE